MDMLQNEIGVERCSFYSSLPGPFQTVQRAELCGVIFALQATTPIHLGVDNLNVVRYVSRVLSGTSCGRPFELCTDGDLLTLLLISFERGVRTLFRSLILGDTWYGTVGCVFRIKLVMILLMELLTSVLQPAGNGPLLCSIFIGSSLPLLERLLMMVMEVPHHIAVWDRTERGSLKDDVCSKLSGSLHGSLALRIFGDMAQSAGLLSMLVLLRLLFGLTQLGYWLSRAPFLVAFIGLLLLKTCVSLAFLMFCKFSHVPPNT